MMRKIWRVHDPSYLHYLKNIHYYTVYTESNNTQNILNNIII